MAHADFPAYRGRMEYVCLDCGARHPGDSLLYTCPQCGGVFLLENLDFDKLKERPVIPRRPSLFSFANRYQSSVSPTPTSRVSNAPTNALFTPSDVQCAGYSRSTPRSRSVPIV